MYPLSEDLARAPTERLKHFCCRKCGGVLAQVFDNSGKAVVICGTNHCEPLKIETMYSRTLREAQEVCDAMDVREEYPELFPPVNEEEILKTKKALFPKE